MAASTTTSQSSNHCEFAVLKWPPHTPDLSATQHFGMCLNGRFPSQMCAVLSFQYRKSEAGFQHLTESVKNYGSSQDKKGSNPARVVYIFIPGFAWITQFLIWPQHKTSSKLKVYSHVAEQCYMVTPFDFTHFNCYNCVHLFFFLSASLWPLLTANSYFKTVTSRIPINCVHKIKVKFLKWDVSTQGTFVWMFFWKWWGCSSWSFWLSQVFLSCTMHLKRQGECLLSNCLKIISWTITHSKSWRSHCIIDVYHYTVFEAKYKWI